MPEATGPGQGNLIHGASKVRKDPRVIARALSEGEGGVLLHMDSGAYHGVNQLGLVVWELLDGRRTVADVVEAVRLRVSDSPQELQADVVRFLNRVVERGLVAVVA